MPLLTMSNFTQQIITSLKFIFQFLNSFGPIHAREIETEMIVQLVEFLCIFAASDVAKIVVMFYFILVDNQTND